MEYMSHVIDGLWECSPDLATSSFLVAFLLLQW